MNLPLILGTYLAVINIITFVTYGVDKSKAKKNKFRISEATLLLLAAIGGALGAACGMTFFHHKTKKPKFFVTVPLLLLLEAIVVIFVLIKFAK